ncbi:unnamed protein product [Discula destructiva]
MSFFPLRLRPGFPAIVSRIGGDTPTGASTTSDDSGSPTLLGDNSEGPKNAYKPSAMDVVVLKMMLQQGLHLPAEVVLSILDFAEYWPHTTATLDHSMIVRTGAANENAFVLRMKPLGMIKNVHYDQKYYSSACARPLPLAEDAEYPLEQFQQWIGGPTDIVQHPCRRIVFTITSHDQGWSHNARTDRGTYRGSYTWFEAGLERFDKTATCPKADTDEKDAAADADETASNENSDPSSSAATVDRVNVELPDPYLPVYSLRPIYPPLAADQAAPAFHHDLTASPTHTIQYNKTAVREATTHTIAWSWDDDRNPLMGEALREIGRGEQTGTGEFVRSLKPGDVVSVWAKTRFGGWVNNVDAVKVDVYWAM